LTTTLNRDHTATAMSVTSLPQPAPHRTATLTTALRNHRNHGDLLPLAAHLTRHGLRNPVSVSPDGQVLIGERRFLAATLAGLDVIPGRTLTTVQQALDVLAAERCADQRDPAAAALAEPPTILALLELDAAIRVLEWWPREGGSTGSREDHRGALARVADSLDGTRFWNNSQYSHGRALWLAAQGLRSNAGGRPLRIPERDKEAAAELVASFDHRETHRITTAHTGWRASVILTPRRARVVSASLRTFGSAEVPALLASLRGFTGAVIAAGKPGPDLTADQHADLNVALTELVNHLNNLRKGLRK
jgi:hypothetical protein